MPKAVPLKAEQRKENRRVRYTRMALRESLLSLLQEYPLNKITVSQICEHADVNRSTFYLYYKDAYDLLDQIETELYEQIFQAVEGATRPLLGEETLQRIFEIIYKNRDLCRVIFGEYGDKSFLRKVGSIHKDRMLREWRHLAPSLDESTLNYLHTFASYANIGLLERWVASDFHETPRPAGRHGQQVLKPRPLAVFQQAVILRKEGAEAQQAGMVNKIYDVHVSG